MNIGMLWFDNDPVQGLDAKVKRAASYYQEKYGKTPTVCFVHPSMIFDSDSVQQEASSKPKIRILTGEVEVRSNNSILPNHFWIGVNGIKTPSPGS